MGKQASSAGKKQRESEWRNRIVRHAASKQSIEAFCRSEAVSTASFYLWRARLRSHNVVGTRTQVMVPAQSPFIDLGLAKGLAANAAAPRSDDMPHPSHPNIEVRIDLGCGVVLTIARR